MDIPNEMNPIDKSINEAIEKIKKNPRSLGYIRIQIPYFLCNPIDKDLGFFFIF